MTPRRAALLLALSLALAGCGGSGDADAAGGPRLAFVTNGVDPFWTIARAGVRAAEKEFSVDCEVKMPAGGTVEEQRRIVEELLTREKDGIAISPIDAANLIDLIDMGLGARRDLSSIDHRHNGKLLASHLLLTQVV